MLGPPVRRRLRRRRPAHAGPGRLRQALRRRARASSQRRQDRTRASTAGGATKRTEGRRRRARCSPSWCRASSPASPGPRPCAGGAANGPWVRPVHGVVSLLDGEVVPFELFGVAAGKRDRRPSDALARAFAVDRRRGLPRASSPRAASRSRPGERRRRAARGDARPRRGARRPPGRGRRAARQARRDLRDPRRAWKGSFDAGVPRAAARGADHQPARPPERLHRRGTGRRACCRASSPSWTGPTIPTAGCAPATSGWWRRGSRTPASSTARTARRRSPQRAEQLDAPDLPREAGELRRQDRAPGRRSPRRSASELGWASSESGAAAAAARLLKVDLATEMVKEFTSLQGIMGGIYAREEGQPEEVWQAIYDQYLPASTGRPPAARPRRAGRRPRRPHRHAGRHLRPRPGAHRQQGPVRPAPRRPGRGAHRARGRAAARPGRARRRAPRSLYGDRLTRSAEADPGRPAAVPPRPRALRARPRRATPTTRSRRRSARWRRQPAGPARPASTPSTGCARSRPSSPWCWRPSASRTSSRTPPSTARRAAAHASPPSATSTRPSRACAPRWRRPPRAGDYERCLRRIADLAPVLDRFFVEVLVMDEDPNVRRNRLALLQAIHRSVSRDRAPHRDGGGQGRGPGAGGGRRLARAAVQEKSQSSCDSTKIDPGLIPIGGNDEAWIQGMERWDRAAGQRPGRLAVVPAGRDRRGRGRPRRGG